MKVLHILSSSKYSGAENVVCQIIQMFKGGKYQMGYCSPNGTIKDTLANMDIEFIPIAGISVAEVKRAIIKYSPDIIHAHDMRASYIAARACGKIPLVSHIHNNNFDSRNLSIKALGYFYAANKAKKIIWVSKSSFDGYKFSSFFKKKSTILYNVINLKALREKANKGTDKYNFDIVFIGRLTIQKNPMRLLDILKNVVEKKHSIKIGIIGTGDLEDEVRKKVNDYGLTDNITITGYMNNPMRILQNSKVMVMSSLWEGTPMCVLEAMGLGTPVVSTPVDGLKDIIISKINGFLSDSDEELSTILVNIVEDDKLRMRLSSNALKDAERINDVETYKATLENIYDSL